MNSSGHMYQEEEKMGEGEHQLWGDISLVVENQL